ncbi:tetratricopeptide repeat protein [Sporanaerobium hydrogeniformans]|uniref:tetratricopeptide repeat protein n=1 Tax=Sporanaerobium hydrogeniformans TaxID=3072179 RepID=UPI0015D48685|nr:tetratricopeptide repeat protein [Sporanaerobium hydrogeniformans]
MRKKIIRQILFLKNTYGEELLQDKKRLMAFVRDYFPFAKWEHQLLQLGLASDIYGQLKGCDIHTCMLKRNECICLLQKEQGCERRLAEEAVDLWMSLIKKEKNIDTAFSEDKPLVQKLGEASGKQQEKLMLSEKAEAILRRGDAFYSGEGIRQSYKEALKTYEEAASLGSVAAMKYLGNMYYIGQGVGQDYERALFWYKEAASQGSATAMNYLGNMYHEGKGTTAQQEKALQWYQRAVALGNYTAMFNIGYLQHEKHLQKEQQSFEWYEKKAQLGNKEAIYHLAYLYHTGDGVEQDYEKAMKWYRKLAEDGYTYAMIWIAYMYLNGQGVEKDYHEAMSWCAKAAQFLEPLENKRDC